MAKKRRETILEDQPLWYKDVVIYELNIKSFHDSDGDGIGDFKGLVEKLDYLADLGVTALWLLPFYPSPLKDDGYDIADYFSVHPDYGTLGDFKLFLREAHRRGMRVITELVVNHTSDQHPWFQRARKAKPGSRWRDFYVWSDTPEKYRDARIIFKDFESSNWSWDPVAKSYYWHRFYSHQPDLNYDNPHVRKEIFRVLDFWFGMGVDGLRLDAVPYLFEREGTNCENLQETYDFLRELRAHVDGKWKNRMLLAEANQWPEDAARYFGDGGMCHMAYHFPLMPRMFMAIQMEDRFPMLDILEQTPDIPETCQWAMFLRNHDELTLEMVTDEERDYMYRVYARDPRARLNLGIRRRLAPLIGNDRRKIELMNMLLLTMPGTPIIYYGDEIGMGDNYYLGDRNGVRTPMQWSPDRNAGFSRANPQKLYMPIIIDPEYHYEAVNVENQQMSSASLLWWMKRTLAMRKRFKAFGRGSLEFLMPDNPKVLSYVRQYDDETLLVVVNMSRFSQVAELDLSRFAGLVPEDVFSFNEFPYIKESPYILTLVPHAYYVFQLRPAKEEISAEKKELPELKVSGKWEKVLEGRSLEGLLRRVLPDYLAGKRWFGGKARRIRNISLVEDIPVRENGSFAHLLFLEVRYTEGPSETYVLPISFAPMGGMPGGEEITAEGISVRLDLDWLTVKAAKITEDYPQAVIASLTVDSEEGILYDSMYNQGFRENLLRLIAHSRRLRGSQGDLVFLPGRKFRSILGKGPTPSSQVLKVEQSNTSAVYEDKFFFKLYRRLEEGMNPDPEISRFLTDRAGFPNIAPFAGAVEYRRKGFETSVVALMQGLVQNQGDAWIHTLDSVSRYCERILALKPSERKVPEVPDSLLGLDFSAIPHQLQELIGGVYPEVAALLGKRTGEMHLALASSPGDPDFGPEPFSMLYQRSVYQSMRSLARRVMLALGKAQRKIPEGLGQDVKSILSAEKKILARFGRVLEKKFESTKIRIHGDYHLGQVLYTGKDFIIIDFEGEPARALSERRLKRSPLVDVAGMIRSFHYATYGALFMHASVRAEDVAELEPWMEPWYHWISAIFLNSYLKAVQGSTIVPGEEADLEALLNAFILEKAVYELGYEMNNRPDWVAIPIKGIQHILRTSK
ncbi:MAG: maltose alpha-D-glucosyltransferase [Nitrospirota bacterium]